MVGNDFPPLLNFRDNEARGIFPDIIRAVSRQSGVPVHFAFMPWARALATVKNEPGVCAIPASQTPERETLFAWVKSVYRSEWKFFALDDKALRISTLEDARPFHIGVESGSSRDEYLTKAGGFTLERAISDEANLRKLAAGRIDLWADSADVPPRMARGTDIKIKPVFTFHSGDIGIACNPDTDGVLMGRVRQAFETLRATDQIKAITEAYSPGE